MDSASIFQFVNTLVLPFWLLLMIYPSWKYRNNAIYIAVGLLAVVYTVFMLLGPPMDLEAFSNLEGVMSLFTQPEAVLVGWVHYLAFDLLVGNWIVEQSKALKIKHVFILPCLLFTFILGPVGYLLFSIIKISKIGRTS